MVSSGYTTASGLNIQVGFYTSVLGSVWFTAHVVAVTTTIAVSSRATSAIE